jgi:hypothetical protein
MDPQPAQLAMTYPQQIRLLILDKALIGVLILISGFLINVAFENVKSYLERERNDRSSLLTYHTQRLNTFLYPLLYDIERDDAVYVEMYQKDKAIPTKSDLGRLIEMDVILPNHDKILSLLENNSAYIGNSTQLRDTIKQYQRHIAVLKALRKQGDFSDAYVKSKEAGFPPDFSKVVQGEIDSENVAISSLMTVH